MASISIQRKNFVFQAPSLGKPNPYDPKGPRVAQNGQKGDNCVYATFNFFRHRQIKTATGPEREIEKLGSQWRKQRTLLYKKIGVFRGFAKDLTKSAFTKRDAQEAMERAPLVNRCEYIALLQLFYHCSAHENLTAFVEQYYVWESIKIHLTFLIKTAVYFKKTPAIGVSWTGKKRIVDQIALNERDLFNAVKGRLCILYGIGRADWHPCHGIRQLMQDINRHGALGVSGMLGRFFFATPPKVVDSIEGRPIYSGTPLSFSKGTSVHSVVVVGAETNTLGEWVYLFDPVNGTHPDTPATQMFYKISYLQFINNIADFNGIMYRNSDGRALFSYPLREKNLYALHGSQKC
ncbi:MAG TPA: hypothetical protein VGJ00_02415 [Rhabdochlamydiaceae bacterium]|jgi:hypothetical protein